jgi:rhamnosyl/mannosyltransferase
MVRLLIVTKLFEPVIGGVETTVAQIARELGTGDQFVITILAGNEKSFKGHHEYRWHHARVIKTSSFGMLHHTAISPSYFVTLARLIKENDVIHFHSPNLLGDLVGAFIKIPDGKKTIVSLHADLRQTRKKLFAPLYNWFLRRLLQQADLITTMSEQNAGSFKILNDFAGKVRIVPLAYDAANTVTISDEQKKNFREQFGISASMPVLLFVGRITVDKGLSYLLAAARQMENLQLIITGEGSLLHALKKEAIGLQRVIFTGTLTGAELAAAYSNADLFVLPSVRETYGIVQAEALWYGIPVINTQLGSGVNFVSPHDVTGITVPPADVNALAGAIRSILFNRERYDRYHINALQRSELFSPAIMARRFCEIYQEALP